MIRAREQKPRTRRRAQPHLMGCDHAYSMAAEKGEPFASAFLWNTRRGLG